MNQNTHALRPRSARLAVGIATVTLAFAFTVGCSFSAGTQSVTVGTKDEVRYSGTATQAEATALGQSLKTQGYFQDRGTSVVLTKGSGGTVIGFVVQDGYWDKEDVYATFEQMARTAAPVVGGFPVKLQFLSTRLEMKKELDVHPVYMAGTDEVRYGGTATEQDAKALADALKSLDYLQNRGVTVLIRKGASGTVVGFAVQDGAWNNDETVGTFEKIGEAIAPAVGGAPIRVQLLNTLLEKQKEIPIS